MKSENWWWGRSASVDLHGCDHELVKDPETIKKFVRALAKVIKMKRVGPPIIMRLGHGKLRGYSVMQLIETSTIIAHLDEKGNRAFIDVFSCRQFNPKTVAKFCQKFFKAKNFSTYVEERL